LTNFRNWSNRYFYSSWYEKRLGLEITVHIDKDKNPKKECGSYPKIRLRLYGARGIKRDVYSRDYKPV
jgi:hypothetical protein